MLQNKEGPNLTQGRLKPKIRKAQTQNKEGPSPKLKAQFVETS